jgi:isoamylase
MDYTGTGNTLNMRHPHVLQLIMDSLRYWVTEMHVDGFRFDLAATLARELHDVDRLSAFFDIIQQDPVISQVKLIAEPWDVGEGGYQVGNFPPLWSEWNGKYRDSVRDYWRGTTRRSPSSPTASPAAPICTRTPAPAPCQRQLHHGARRLHAARSVSYNEKHNEANGEDNRDGESHNRSWNCGAEGPTDDPASRPARRQQRNFLDHAVAVAGRADAARRRRDRPHAGRQQQRLLPGQRGVVVRLGARRRRPAAVPARRRDPAVRRHGGRACGHATAGAPIRLEDGTC